MSNNFHFGTVGSPITTPKKPGGSLGAIQQIASLGLDTLELGWVQSVRVSEETCLAIALEAQKHDIQLSVHAPYYINLNATSEEWPKSRQRLMDAAYYGALAGATDIIFHPGSYFTASPADVLKVAIPRLADCVAELAAKKIKVTLRPETMGKAALLGSLEDTLQMSQAVPGVIPCIDFAHLHARTGGGSLNSYEEWTHLLEYYASLLGEPSLQHLHIHLSGIEYSLKGERNHLPLLESDFAYPQLLRALADMNCGGRILCESPIMEEDALLLRDTWQSIARN